VRTLLAHVAWLAALAATVPTHVDAANAALAAKPEDRATIGVAASPDRRPADPHAPRLKRMPGSSAASAVALPPVEKPQPFATSSPADPANLNAEQRQKLAAAAALSAPVQSSEVTGGKPAEHSTIVPLEPGARRVAIENGKLGLRSLAMPATSAVRMGAGSLTGALGVIPRPEWSGQISHAKPKDVSTIIPAPAGGATIVPPPPAVEPRPRATQVMKLKAVPKAPQVTTATPRDPSLPPPSATKPASPESAKQEVRP
jgi:hypothetical protein